MERNIDIVNAERFVKSIQDMNCGKTPFSHLDAVDFKIDPFDIPVPEGYEPPEKFPLCCPFHESTFLNVKEWVARFPACCAGHRRLLSAQWFDKSIYDNLGLKVLNQLGYTEHVISQKKDKDDWYEDITEYIEFNHDSFGQLPTGYGGTPGLDQYFQGILLGLKESKTLNSDKSKRLQEFIEGYYRRQGAKQVDLNQLYNVYKRWLSFFPFNIAYFRESKDYFQRRFPILKGRIVQNRYSKVAKAKLLTQSELIEWLIQITKELLLAIKSHDLVLNNLIPDSNKHALELMLENHRIRQEALLIAFTQGELEYVRILKKWMKREKEFFAELNKNMNISPAPHKKQYAPPDNEDYFEDFVCELYNLQHPDAHFERFGKRGDKQKGIDIFSITRREAIQCKKKDLSRKASEVKSELKAEFESDIRQAMTVSGVDVQLMIFASTFGNNTDLEESLQSIATALKAPFKVMYIGWTSISTKMQNFPLFIRRHYP
ncbi:hypothetical protein WBG78_15735 [Chryseolinea sp. T2]|uniref:hypothetical protein n=1 Tax=Chryseolinea sp. T2 TaxID=3129255 RepID=UPI0030779766